MNARLGYAVGALLLGAGAFFGFHFSGASFTDDSHLPTQVSAARDWTPPMVSVDDPGYLINGEVTISATAADEVTDVVSVAIQYRPVTGDWTPLCVDSEAPWSCAWDTDTVTDGDVELRAIATDEVGNTEISATVATEVRNARGVALSPVPSPVRGEIALVAQLVNPRPGPSYLTFQRSAPGTGWLDLPGCVDLDGPEASCVFDTTLVPDGTYDLRVVATQDPREYTDVEPGLVVDNTAPQVSIDQAAGQADPSGAAPVSFTAVFSEPVSDFDADDVTVGGTVGGVRGVTVTGSGATYTVSVSGLTGTGTLTASIGAGLVTDGAGNAGEASTSTDNQVTVDAEVPTVSVEQAAGQADPTRGDVIDFSVVFSKAVTGFTAEDLFISGTVGPSLDALVTGSGSSYQVSVTGMSTSRTVVLSVPAGGVVDAVGNPNLDSTSVDNSVVYDVTRPSVTIDRATGQASPTNATSVDFTVEFTEPVTGFTGSDVTVSGTAGGTKSITVTGSGTTYNVAVSGMSGDGTVTVSVPAGGSADAAGNTNLGSTSTDATVTWDTTGPGVTVDQAASQADPTNVSPIDFTVVFTEPVTGFTGSDVTVSGTAGGTKSITVTGSGTTYNVAVSGMSGDGTVTVSVPAGGSADAAGNTNLGSSSTDATVTWDTTGPGVTVDQAASQADPTNVSPIDFTVVFTEPVTGFTGSDVTVSGTAGGTKSITVTGSGTTYNVAVSGMSGDGTVTASVPAGGAGDALGNTNLGSSSTDATVTWDTTGPGVTVDQAASQADPTNVSPINFTVVFTEPVSGFIGSDVTLGGTTNGTKTATVTGSGTTYNVAVTGMTGQGTVTASVPAGRAVDGDGNSNSASTSTDNSVTRDTVAPTPTIVRVGSSTTTSSPINYTVDFGEPVTGFSEDDLTITGTSGGTKVVTVTGSGDTYNVAITGMTTSGTVIVSQVPDDAAVDLAGNGNANSSATASARTTTWDDSVAPTVTIDQAADQADPTAGSTVRFTVVFSEPVTGFANNDVVITGSAGGTKTVSLSGSGPTYTATVSGITSTGTVIATIAASRVQDLADRDNTASTSTDNTVTYDACAEGSSTLTAVADAWTDQASQSQNKGVDSTLLVESKSGSANKRAFVKFSLPVLPSGCTLTAATLELHNASPTSGRTINVLRASSSWVESTITWGNQPGSAGTAVGSTTGSSAGVQQWNVFDHVQTHYSVANHGFLIRDAAEASSASPKQGYMSRESGENRPQLVVTWN